MAALDVAVEIGLDLGEDDPTAFALDDATRGVLDNTAHLLGGELFFDITGRVRSISSRRGKNQALDKIDAGLGSIVFDNSDRFFDPLYPESQFYQFLIPRREVRVLANDYPVYRGFIDDLDFDYSPGGVSTVRVDMSDAFSNLSNARLPELEPDSELPGERINYVLDQPEVSWPAALRQIDDGLNTLLDNTIEEGTGVLSYLQLVSQSEFGDLFISRAGEVVFRASNAALNSKNVAFTDDLTPTATTKIPYTALNTIYGSENLYNRIVISNADVIPDEVTAEDLDAQKLFGVRSFQQTDLLTQNLADIQTVADELLATYKDPRYRFESVVVSLDKLDDTQADAILDLEIGDLVIATFTPNKIPPAITFPVRIIGINHDWTPTQKRVTFSLETLIYGAFILDNPSFGVLDSSTLSQW